MIKHYVQVKHSKLALYQVQNADTACQTVLFLFMIKCELLGFGGKRGYADMRICGYADMRVCGYAGMRTCGYADKTQKIIAVKESLYVVKHT